MTCRVRRTPSVEEVQLRQIGSAWANDSRAAVLNVCLLHSEEQFDRMLQRQQGSVVMGTIEHHNESKSNSAQEYRCTMRRRKAPPPNATDPHHLRCMGLGTMSTSLPRGLTSFCISSKFALDSIHPPLYTAGDARQQSRLL